MGNRMPQIDRNRKFARAALCATFGVFLVIAGGTASFAADDDDDELPDAKFVRGLLRGLGLRNGQEAGIEYKERPPLVVPPSRDLPIPATAGSLAASNPAWPVDPDEKRRASERKAKAQRKPYNPETDGNPLRPNELAVGRTDKPSVKSSPGPDVSPEMRPSELGYTGGLWNSVFGTFNKDKDTETARFMREPPRDSLTDPPVGYRTPSAEYPYGVNTKAAPRKAQTNEDRQTAGVDGK
jgi:hypothetical protein